MTALSFFDRLSLPLIAAPMLRISGPDLVIAACRAGIVGAFPTSNARTAENLDRWLVEIEDALSDRDAPICPNLIMRHPRLAEQLAVLCAHPIEVVITSVGSPGPAVETLHAHGTLVLADVASVEHARKAIAVGVDGLVLLSGGAGGQSGWANPLAFVRAVRAFYPGPIVLAGGIADGHALAAARVLGADLGYMGTRLIATVESLAGDEYRRMLIDSTLDDVQLTRAFTGLPANMLRPSIIAAGLDPDGLDEQASAPDSEALWGAGSHSGPRRWQDIYSAGHTVSAVTKATTIAELVGLVRSEFDEHPEARKRWQHARRPPAQTR